jgi:ectoine hydroxylase-related dioxygenase (phytanoyl-CoA dioxygenase family)
MWVKNPLDGSFTTWHQDSAYFDYDPPEVWSAWIALTDSREEHGCLRYGRGTHLGPSLSHVETEDDKNLLSRGQYIPDFDDSSMALAEVNAGEAVLHHFRCAHSSLPNTTDQRRIGVLFVYCPTNVRATLGRYSGTCVRGEDKFGYWDAEPAVERDLDPAALDYVRGLNARYFDKVVRSEAEREQTSG